MVAVVLPAMTPAAMAMAEAQVAHTAVVFDWADQRRRRGGCERPAAFYPGQAGGAAIGHVL